jgi:hypothetical protein
MQIRCDCGKNEAGLFLVDIVGGGDAPGEVIILCPGCESSYRIEIARGAAFREAPVEGAEGRV